MNCGNNVRESSVNEGVHNPSSTPVNPFQQMVGNDGNQPNQVNMEMHNPNSTPVNSVQQMVGNDGSLPNQANMEMHNPNSTPVNPFQQMVGNDGNQPNQVNMEIHNPVPINQPNPSMNPTQPMMSQQPAYNNVPNYGTPKKNNTTLIAMGAILFVAFAVIIFLVFFRGDGTGNRGGLAADRDWHETTFAEFRIDVHNDWKYEHNRANQTFIVGRTDDELVMVIEILNQTYSQTVANKSQIIQNITTIHGLNYQKDYETTIDGKKVFVILFLDEYDEYIGMAVTQLDTGRITIGTIVSYYDNERQFTSAIEPFLRSLASVGPNSSLAHNMNITKDPGRITDIFRVE